MPDETSAHQQFTGHLASHCHDVIFAEAGFHQVGDKQLQPVGWAWVAHLTEIRREDERRSQRSFPPIRPCLVMEASTSTIARTATSAVISEIS